MKPTATNPARVLIAAETPLETLELQDMLQGGAPLSVRVTCDAREIVPLYDKWPYAVLILDMDMTSRPSLEVLRDFSSLIDAHRLAVLTLSPEQTEARIKHALRAGASHVISRPLQKEDVVLHVNLALRTLSAGTA